MIAHHERRLDDDAHVADGFSQLARPLDEPGPQTAIIEQVSKQGSFLFGGLSPHDPDFAACAEGMIGGGDPALRPGEKEFTHSADSLSKALFTFSFCETIVIVESRGENFENFPVPLLMACTRRKSATR